MALKLEKLCRTPELVEMAIAFIEPYEKFNIHFFEKIFKEDEPVYVIGDSKIAGIFTLSKGGTFSCCIPKWTREIESIISKYLRDKNIKCVHGEESNVLRIEKILKGLYQQTEERNMFLMEHEDEFINDSNYDFGRCTKQDAEELMPLQKGFVSEESLPPWGAVNLPSVRLNLDKDIENGLVYYTGDFKKICCKLNVSRYGIHYSLISGVYTLNEFRNRGFATFLVSRISSLMIQSERKGVLFVRQNNEGAIKAYRNAGYVITGTYKIVYFNGRNL